MTAQAIPTRLLSRRAFLAQGGALVVTFALASRPIARAKRRAPADKTVAADEVAGFIAIDATGKVTIYSGKVELGTGAAHGDRPDRRRRTVGVARSRNDDPGRYRS